MFVPFVPGWPSHGLFLAPGQAAHRVPHGGPVSAGPVQPNFTPLRAAFWTAKHNPGPGLAQNAQPKFHIENRVVSWPKTRSPSPTTA